MAQVGTLLPRKVVKGRTRIEQEQKDRKLRDNKRTNT